MKTTITALALSLLASPALAVGTGITEYFTYDATAEEVQHVLATGSRCAKTNEAKDGTKIIYFATRKDIETMGDGLMVLDVANGKFTKLGPNLAWRIYNDFCYVDDQ